MFANRKKIIDKFICNIKKQCIHSFISFRYYKTIQDFCLFLYQFNHLIIFHYFDDINNNSLTLLFYVFCSNKNWKKPIFVKVFISLLSMFKLFRTLNKKTFQKIADNISLFLITNIFLLYIHFNKSINYKITICSCH